MKKYLAEMVGTMVLVLMGCGVAVSLGCDPINNIPAVVGTAFAFGLSVVAMAYTIGGISGCHINPAITFGVALSGRMKWGEAIGYWIGQIVGAIIAGAVLLLLSKVVTAPDLTGGLGTNGVANAGGPWGACLVEFIATFLFVFVVLGTTDAKKGAGNFAGLAIGLTLILIHLVCINLTGTSVNPARSIGPALFAGGDALKDVWVFICAPLVGGALAACAWKGMVPKEK